MIPENINFSYKLNGLGTNLSYSRAEMAWLFIHLKFDGSMSNIELSIKDQWIVSNKIIQLESLSILTYLRHDVMRNRGKQLIACLEENSPV